jgi:hypothetical protein
MDEMVEHSNEGFKHEDLAKVTYIFGVIQDQLGETAQNFDWDEIVVESELIVADWRNFVDIKDTEEEGYIMKYAERIFFEKYGK